MCVCVCVCADIYGVCVCCVTAEFSVTKYLIQVRGSLWCQSTQSLFPGARAQRRIERPALFATRGFGDASYTPGTTRARSQADTKTPLYSAFHKPRIAVLHALLGQA